MSEESNDATTTTEAEANRDLADFFAQRREPQVRNADNKGLGSWGGPGYCVGYVDEVNGPGAGEVVGFVPTRHELLELARYWATVAVDLEYFRFLHGQYSSDRYRQQCFAWRRVGRIQELLCEDADKVVDEVYEKFGKEQNQKYWETFLRGNAEQREAVREEPARAMGEWDENQSDQ
ncbi:MAG: hypothetical protein ABSC64_03355 [Candidatus Korobacteraceae bacterium]|jgi:hypothetical protein